MKALLLALLASRSAFACGPENLTLDFPSSASGDSPAQVTFALRGQTLHAHFTVRGPVLSRKLKYGPTDFPYQYDVTELFLSVEGGLPYYEFEVTPYNQTLQVKIIDLKHPFVNNVNMGLETKTTHTPKGWTTDLWIPLDRLGWRGDVSQLVGNAYAIVGKKPDRRYYVRSPLPEQEKPNFHVPTAFKALLDCVEPKPAT